jgi:hypothetical protein
VTHSSRIKAAVLQRGLHVTFLFSLLFPFEKRLRYLFQFGLKLDTDMQFGRKKLDLEVRAVIFLQRTSPWGQGTKVNPARPGEVTGAFPRRRVMLETCKVRLDHVGQARDQKP